MPLAPPAPLLQPCPSRAHARAPPPRPDCLPGSAPGMSAFFLSQKMAQKEPEKWMPSTHANATRRSAKLRDEQIQRIAHSALAAAGGRFGRGGAGSGGGQGAAMGRTCNLHGSSVRGPPGILPFMPTSPAATATGSDDHPPPHA